MLQSESSEKATVPTGMLAFCYCIAIGWLGWLIISNYVDAQPGNAVAVANQALWWMIAAGMVAGALAAWQVEADTLPGPMRVVTSIVLLEVGVVCGLLSAPLLLRSWVFTVDGEASSGRVYFAWHFLPSSEAIAASSAYVGVSYALLLLLPMLRRQAAALHVLLPLVAAAGLITIGYCNWVAFTLHADRPVAGAIVSQVHSQEPEERGKSVARDCEGGNGKACLDWVFAERRTHGEEGEQRVYTQLCQRNAQMEFPPCVELAAMLSHKTTQEAAIDQVCALHVDGCKAVAQAFEARYTMGYAQRAHQAVCTQRPGDESCQRAQELDAFVEQELMAPVQPAGDGPFCDFEPKSCLRLITDAMHDGNFAHASWLAFTYCRSQKSELDSCGTWLDVARRRTYFAETVTHLVEAHALKAPVDDPKAIASLVTQRCGKKDGMSCFFQAVLEEIDHPKEVERARTWYQRACDLGYVRGCTNALSISTRHPGEGLPLPSDAEPRFTALCFDRNEAEACGQLAVLAADQFTWRGVRREPVDRPAVRKLLEDTCQREVAARLGDKDACRTYVRMKRVSTLMQG